MMKVAISASGTNLDSEIDPRFGRCAYFVIVDTEDMGFEAFPNDSMSLGGGAGIQSAQFVASTGAKAVITGNCGPNAVRTLSAAGVSLITGQTGSVREAVERYKRGELKATDAPNVSDHFGMGAGRGMGRGMGQGQGMGMPGSGRRDRTPLSREEELDSLKKQASDLKNQMEEIQDRIKDLEKKG